MVPLKEFISLNNMLLNYELLRHVEAQSREMILLEAVKDILFDMEQEQGSRVRSVARGLQELICMGG
ncbi:MAG: hypothetical protein ACUVTM_08465 [Candidatus Bathyarchaeia archaeon]